MLWEKTSWQPNIEQNLAIRSDTYFLLDLSLDTALTRNFLSRARIIILSIHKKCEKRLFGSSYDRHPVIKIINNTFTIIAFYISSDNIYCCYYALPSVTFIYCHSCWHILIQSWGSRHLPWFLKFSHLRTSTWRGRSENWRRSTP